MERHPIVLAHPDASLVHPWPIRAVSAGDCHQGSARTFWFLLCLQDIHLLSILPYSLQTRSALGEEAAQERHLRQKPFLLQSQKSLSPPRRTGRERGSTTQATREHRHTTLGKASSAAKPRCDFPTPYFGVETRSTSQLLSSLRAELHPMVARSCWQHTRHCWHSQKGFLHSFPLSRSSGWQQGPCLVSREQNADAACRERGG